MIALFLLIHFLEGFFNLISGMLIYDQYTGIFRPYLSGDVCARKSL